MALVPRSDLQGRRMIEFIMSFVAQQPPLEDESLSDTLKRVALSLPEGGLQQELTRLEMLLRQQPS